MSTGNGNGYKVAFWVMATIATVGMGMLTTAIINNDRLRETKDCELMDRFVNLREQANDCLHKIDLRLSRIEQRLDVNGTKKIP